MKRRPSPTTVIACLALFFSLGGVGLAASRYVITSPSQIAPRVRAKLDGAYYRSDATTSPLGHAAFVVACRPGDRILGVEYHGRGDIVSTSESVPDGSFSAWQLVAHRDPAYRGDAYISVWASCVHAPS